MECDVPVEVYAHCISSSVISLVIIAPLVLVITCHCSYHGLTTLGLLLSLTPVLSISLMQELIRNLNLPAISFSSGFNIFFIPVTWAFLEGIYQETSLALDNSFGSTP